ncbi:hypothetical protein Tco_0331663 [Tanacetum coccineum]
MRRVGAFVPMETEIRREVPELAAGIPEEGMNVEALQTKYQIIDWEVELKRLFQLDVDDKLWKSQKHVHDITWRLYDTCGVHHVSIKDGIDIYMLVEKEYPFSRGVLTQMLAAKLLVEQNNEMSRELLRKIFMMAERPRSNMRRDSKGYTGMGISLFPTMLVQGPIVQGEGLTVLVESYHTPTADEVVSTGVDVRHGGAATTVSSLDARQGSGNIDKTPTIPHDSPLLRVYTLGSDEGRMQHNELMDLVTKLSDRVVALETDLRQTKKVYGAAYTKLVKKVKRLERAAKSSQSRRRANIMVSDDEDDFDVNAAGAAVTTAGAANSTANPPRVSTAEDISTAKTLVYIRRSATKDKGKAKMDESEPKQTKTKLQQRQERAGYEAAVRLIQAEEREKYFEAEKVRLLTELINQRKRYFAQQRAEERRNKPLTQAQQRTYMSNYIKHMGSHTLQQLKRLSFDELKNLFEATMRRVGAFIPMETEMKREVPELATGSSKRDA